MRPPKLRPIASMEGLRDRVHSLIGDRHRSSISKNQFAFDFNQRDPAATRIEYPTESLSLFLDFLTDCIPNGDLYLFGGLLRDIALFGKRGFSSDIDLVVEGDWMHLEQYLLRSKAIRNKFGGFRLSVAGWPVDIWHAPDTWAFKQGLVTYQGVASLTSTTVLNWDAILMNWRTKAFIHRERYFEQLIEREMDIVLEENPNPIGMATRVFRHFCHKDARRISPAAATYLSKCARTYDFETIKNAEIKSYGNSIVEPLVHRYFWMLEAYGERDIQEQFGIVSKLVEQELELKSCAS